MLTNSLQYDTNTSQLATGLYENHRAIEHPRRHHGKVNTNDKIIERGRTSFTNQKNYELLQIWTLYAGQHQTLGLQRLSHVKNQLQNLCPQSSPTRHSKNFLCGEGLGHASFSHPTT